MLLPIVSLGDPVLRQRTRDLSDDEITSEALRRTVDDMRETMRAAPGVGLAAPQVGLDFNLAVIEDTPHYIDEDHESNLLERRVVPFFTLINASYRPVGDVTRTFFEGCLSMEGYRALVTRHHRVLARWTDLTGQHHEEEFAGWAARIVQHEVDHLDGTVYIDRCQPRSMTTLENLDALWSDVSVNQVRKQLDVDR